MLPPFPDYCQLLADLSQQFPAIQTSTLQAHTIGKYVAEIEGQVTFAAGYVLTVWELLDLSIQTIRKYMDRDGERVWWYDPMEHSENPTLQSTFPHHKHVFPDIKHHRIPAPNISFTSPNPPFLILEIEQLLPP